MIRLKNVLTICFWIGSASPCFANVGVPMIAFGFPFAIALLIPVIVIESLVIARCLGLEVGKVYRFVVSANIFSTLLGYPLAWLLHLLLQIVFTFSFMAVVPKNYEMPDSSLWDGLGFLVQTAWLVPSEASFWWMLPAAGFVGLIPAYFMSVMIELKILARRWPDLISLRRIVRRANLGSYSFFVVLLLSVWIWNYSKPDHRLQPLMEMAMVHKNGEFYEVLIGNDRKTEKILNEMLKIKTIRSVHFSHDKKIGELMPKLAELSQLQELGFRGSDIKSEQLWHLKELTNLRILTIVDVPIDGNAFVRWPMMPSILELDLSGTRFKDEDLKTLKVFPNLAIVKLRNTDVSGTGFAHISHMENITDLNLEGSAVTDESMAGVGTLRSLVHLSLARTGITDDGLLPIRNLEKLKVLDLGRTRITEQGLARISSLRSLKRLEIGNTQVPRTALKSLSELFPDVDIVFN